MKRDIDQLSHSRFDVLLIGGGVYGAAISLETAKAGLKTALIEKDDFAHATSANSLKILHGGLRYLQHLNIKRMRESIKSRRDFMRFAPHLIKPLACVIPLYGYGLKSREVMQTALFLNDLIGKDRNNGLDSVNHLPDGKILSAQQCIEKIPGIPKEGLRGGALWHDALAIDTERLVTAYLNKAYQYGACMANYLEAKNFVINKKRVNGVKALDKIRGDAVTIEANLVINAAGPWFSDLLSPLKRFKRQQQNWAKSINIIINKSLFDVAVGLESTESYTDKDAFVNKGKRFYFFVPWQKKYTMVGTTYELCKLHPDEAHATTDDIKMFVDEVNAIYPPAQLRFEEVSAVHFGLLPASKDTSADRFNVQLEKNTQIIDHKLIHDTDGLISVKSIKYTTAPENAKKITQYILKHKLRTSDLVVAAHRDPAHSKQNHESISAHADQDIISHLKSVYANDYKKVLKYTGPNGDEWISRNPPLTKAEIIYFIQEEMALKLSDIVFRCTGLGNAECPEETLLHQLADIVGNEFGWDELQKSREISAVLQQFYPLKIKKLS